MKHRLFLLITISMISGISLAQDRSEWFEFYLPWNDSTKTLTDLSSYLDAPAGKHGFLQVTPDGHFKFENGDDKVRFVGAVQVAASCFPEKEYARPLAGRLAKFGINMIRIHAIDGDGDGGIFANSGNNTLDLDEERLDKLDYFIKCLKDKGIYFNFCIQCWRFFKKGDGIDAPIPKSELVTIFNKKLIDLQLDYAKRILAEHINPYTGLAYANDPALLTVELTNENSLLGAFLGWHGWPLIGDDYYSYELDTLFNEWLIDKYHDDDGLGAAWAGPGVTGEELVKNNSLENGAEQWRAYVNKEAGAQASLQLDSTEAYHGNNSGKIIVTSPGKAGWDVQVKTSNFIAEQHEGYRISFYLKGDANKDFQIRLVEDSIWDEVGKRALKSSSEWQRHEITVTTSSLISESVYLEFDFGITTGTFWLDSVSVVSYSGCGLEAGESLEDKSVKRSRLSQFGEHSVRRVGDNAQFYFDLEGRYIKTMTDSLRNGMKVKCPITFTNINFGAAGNYSNSRADYMDIHSYWDLPYYTDDSLKTERRIQNRPMVKDPLASTINHFQLARVKNKPLVLSEYNHPYPQIYQSEAPGLLYAYGGFFELDGIFWHTYYNCHREFQQRHEYMRFDIATNPIVMTQLMLSIPYRMGYIRPVLKTVTARYKKQDVFDNAKYYKGEPVANIPNLKHTTCFLADGFAHGDFDAAVTDVSSGLTDPGKLIESSTKELTWNGNDGIFTVDNPYWQGAVGFLNGKTITLSNIAISDVKTTDNENFAAIHLVALDSQYIAQSEKMILVTAARLEKKDFLWNAGKTWPVNPGGEKALCEPVYGRIKFTGADEDVFAVYTLDTLGNRSEQVAVTFDGTTAAFDLGRKTLWYEIVNSDSAVRVSNKSTVRKPSFQLFQNYPNPMHSNTTIRYNLPDEGEVRMTVCNGIGRTVRTLVQERQGSGFQSINWDGRDDAGQPLISGIYVYRLQINNTVQTKKMILMK